MTERPLRSYIFLLPAALVVSLMLACNLPTRVTQPALSTPDPIPTFTTVPTETLVPTPTVTPTPPPAIRAATGDRALLNGDWDLARQEFEAALSGSPDPQVRAASALGMGRLQYLMGDNPAALNWLRVLIQDTPGSPQAAQAYFALAQTYTRLDRFNEAAEAYQSYLSLRPGLIDYYIYDLRGDVLVQAGELNAAIESYRAAIQAPHITDSLDVELKIARAHAASGDIETALVQFRDVYERTGNDFTRAQIDLLIGNAYVTLGQMDQAYASYLHAVENFPLSYDSYLALVELVNAGIPVDEYDRGLVDYHAGQYGVAIAAFDRYLASQEGIQTAPARYYKGLSLRALREYQSAMDELERVIQEYPDHTLWDDAWEQKAYTLWAFLDQYPQAVKTLVDFVARVPGHPRAAEFLFDAARIAERDADLTLAADLWERVATEYPLYESAYESLFLSGISHYRRKDMQEALDKFTRSLALAMQPAQQAASHLWIGKCELAMGESSAARGAWERAAVADPTGYYSERARDLLLGRAAFTPPQAYDLGVDRHAEQQLAASWMNTVFALPEGTDLAGPGELVEDSRLQRGTELWRLGLLEEARREFESLRLAVQSDPVATYRLSNYLADLGLYRSAIFAARQVLRLAGLNDAETLTAPNHFNHIRFGTYYSDLVLPIAQAYDFHPLFIFSLIRQESLFEGFVRSSAGARGLMQIIPSTGQSIYELNGWPPGYSADDLYRPKVNITFGIDYLDDQRQLFDGDLYAALAAYNGGPGNSSIWKNLAPDDPDLFLEVVRFAETRLYIKRVYENFAIYRRFYDRTP